MPYFNGKVSPDLTYLYISRTIVFFSNGFFTIFLPIFLYITFGYNIIYTLLFYLVGAILYMIPLPYTTKKIEKFNLKGSLYIATIANILFFLTLSVLVPSNIWPMVIIAQLCATTFRLLYWLPYHTAFTKFSDQNNRMREVSVFTATMHVTAAISPLIAGIILSAASYQILFIIGIVIYALSMIPLLTLADVHEKYTWTYAETWKNLCAKKYRPAMIAYCADGAESAVGLVIWPIFIFNLLDGNYMSIGIISAATISITVLLELTIGKYADTVIDKRKILKVNSFFYAAGWILKLFIITGLQIFLVDAYHKITKALSRNSFDAITYDISADQGHFVDEFTVLKEIALNIGRITLYISAIILVTFVNLQWTFLLAAFATLFVNMIRLQKAQEKNYFL